MSTSVEIWNLGALCRCCHADGNFKSLSALYPYNNDVEVYSEMLRDSLNIEIMQLSFEASYTICDECILRLRDVARFKKQVLMCEKKFEEYCKNELATRVNNEIIKIEVDSIDSADNQAHFDFNQTEELTQSFKIEIECENLNEKIEDTGYGEQVFGNDFDISGIKNEEDVKLQIMPVTLETSQAKCQDIKKKTPRRNDNILKIKPVKTLKKKAQSQGVQWTTPKRKPTAFYDYTLEVHVKTDCATLYSCKACGGSYKDHKFLKRHIMAKHLLGDPYSCDQCKMKFNTDISLNKHKMLHLQSFKCHYCSKIVSTASSLKDHLNSHTRDTLFKCDLCSKEFLYKSTLRNHLKSHYGTRRRYMCDLCGHYFNDTTNMTIHIRTVHEKLRPYQCDMCEKTFAAKKHLVLHIRKHTGDRPFQCDGCEKRFYTNFDKNNHKCGAADNKYECKVCLKTFNDRGTFSKHVRRSHTGQRPYKCMVCCKDFTCKYSMKRHELTHTGIKPYSCTHCPLKFTQKTMLNRHLVRLHDVPLKSSIEKNCTQNSQAQCLVCKRVVNDFISHKSKCHGENKADRATCDVCNKSYSSNTTLNRHKRTVHFGVSFKCDYCDKSYGQRNKLVKHQSKVHGNVLKVERGEYDGPIYTNVDIGDKIENV